MRRIIGAALCLLFLDCGFAQAQSNKPLARAQAVASCNATTACQSAEHCTLTNDADVQAYACFQFTQKKADCWQILQDRQLTSHNRSVVTEYLSAYPAAQCLPPKDMSSAGWCLDDATICWNPNSKALSGVRFIFEPAIGVPIQSGPNHLNLGATTFSGIGTEFNLANAWVSAQIQLLLPFSAAFDDKSAVSSVINTTDKTVTVNYGIAYGFSFIDGVVAVGLAHLFFDTRDFTLATPPAPDTNISGKTFVYVNLQPASTARAVLKRIPKK